MILIDSAKVDEVRQAAQLGWVRGVTTNPTLLAQSGLPPTETLQQLAAIELRPLCYQLVSETEEAMLAEAHKALELVGYELVLKIAPTRVGFDFVLRYNREFRCALTAIYTPAQAIVAGEVGAIYIITYVNRATRLMGDGLAMLSSMAAVLKNARTEIMAASLKSAEEATDAVRAGAQHITIPFNVLLTMMDNQYSSDAIQEFKEKGAGIV